MKFSVIVPVYNAQSCLRQCIESVLAQDFQDFELLLVDDGSKDESGLICDEYAARDSRVRCFHRTNSGVGEARNFGIEQAEGEWLCFVDADDMVTPEYLSVFHTDETEADIVISGIDFVNTQTNDIIRKEHYSPINFNPGKDKEALLPFLSVGFPVAKAYRKDLLKNNSLHFPTDISFHEDHVFVFDCFLSSRQIEVRPEVTYKYRIDYSHDSLSKKRHPWQKHWMASQYMFDRIFKLRDSFGYNDEQLRSIYTFAYEPVISAVYGVYEDKLPRKERIAKLSLFLYDALPIKKYFHPASNRGKLIKTFSQILPPAMLDIFFLGVNRYQNRRK